jgi:3-deoxy-manno-octulosonate cytidylyltransferase (CMP-KDO synthetase)
MIQHVWERVMLVGTLSEAAVATPDEEIARVVRGFGGHAIMTAHSHRSGTDRLAEAAASMGLESRDIVVNIQGDEPLLQPEGIDAVVTLLQEDPSLPMASLMCPCPADDLDNPSCVKVVCAQNGDALYFSRARLPFERAVAQVPVMQHVGLYAYRVAFLLAFAALSPTPLERTESLEQLRALEHGYRIRMARVEQAPIGVDTEDDLERALKRMKDEGVSRKDEG